MGAYTVDGFGRGAPSVDADTTSGRAGDGGRAAAAAAASVGTGGFSEVPVDTVPAL
jgi:hypothetical protein